MTPDGFVSWLQGGVRASQDTAQLAGDLSAASVPAPPAVEPDAAGPAAPSSAVALAPQPAINQFLWTTIATMIVSLLIFMSCLFVQIDRQSLVLAV
jgi:hypothetical protein